MDPAPTAAKCLPGESFVRGLRGSSEGVLDQEEQHTRFSPLEDVSATLYV